MFADAAVKERLQEVDAPRHRGEITDVNGVPLATTVDTVAVTADPQAHPRQRGRDRGSPRADPEGAGRGPRSPKLRTPKSRFIYLARKVPRDHVEEGPERPWTPKG